MAKIVVTFDEIGGIEEFNGLPIAQAEMAIINKAGDYLGEIFGHEFDEKINYNAAHCDWALRKVFMETYPPSAEEQKEKALCAALDKFLNDPETKLVLYGLPSL